MGRLDCKFLILINNEADNIRNIGEKRWAVGQTKCRANWYWLCCMQIAKKK